MDIQGIIIPEGELHFSFARSGGPGGQNVNKVESKAILHWHIAANVSLPSKVRLRLEAQQARRLTTDGFLVIQSQRFRDQPKNIEDCKDKLRDMILLASYEPKPRKLTRPSRGAKERRISAKKQNSQRKSRRSQPKNDD